MRDNRLHHLNIKAALVKAAFFYLETDIVLIRLAFLLADSLGGSASLCKGPILSIEKET